MFYLVSYRGCKWTESHAQIRLLESEHVSPFNWKLPHVQGDLSSNWCQFRGEQFHSIVHLKVLKDKAWMCILKITFRFKIILDVNGDKYLDAYELEAIFQYELDKIYDPNNPEVVSILFVVSKSYLIPDFQKNLII